MGNHLLLMDLWTAGYKIPMITGASATSRIRIKPAGGRCENPSLQKGDLADGKQLMSMQLTSGSGGQTFNEAALRLNRRKKNLALLSYSYCITGIS